MPSNVDEPETWDEQRERLHAMTADSGTWDLSDNDRAAIWAALMRLDELEAARAVVEKSREVPHECLVRIDGKRCTRCKACRFAFALGNYDAAKAGKAVE